MTTNEKATGDVENTTGPAALAQRYFDLAPGPDREAYFDLFRPDAVVEDEGRERHGIAEIRAWRTEVPPVTYTVAEVRPTTAGKIEDVGSDAFVDIAGDFPGSPVRLSFHFEFADDGRIAFLSIRP